MHIPTHLGPLTQLVVGYRPSFPGDRWHLDRVEVTDEGTGLLYIFFCSAWLGDDNTTELHLRVIYCPLHCHITLCCLCH